MPEFEFKQIIKNASRKEIMLLLLFSALIMITSIGITGVPLLFIQPKILCLDENNNYFECTQEIACKQEYKIDLINGIKSITSEFSLICENRFYRSLAEQCILGGEVLVCIFFTFVQIRQKQRQIILVSTFIIAFLISIFLQFANKYYQICIGIFILGASFQTYMLNVYRFITHDFQGNLKLVAPSFINAFWGFSVFLFSLATYLTQNWRQAILYQVTIPSIILTTLLFFTLRMKYTQINISIQQKLISQEYDRKIIKKNKYLFIIIFGLVNSSFYATTLGIDTLYGSVYVNLGAFGLLETASYFVSVFFLKYFKPFELLKYSLNIVIIAQLLFYFQSQKDKENVFQFYLFIILSLIQRFISELIFNFSITYLPQIVDGPSEQKTWSYANLVCLALFMILPYYIEAMRIIELSPVFGLTIFVIISRILLPYTIQIR